MARIEARLTELGLVLPAEPKLPPGVRLPFPWVRVAGARALISGHGPLGTDGALAEPRGKVGAGVDVAAGHALAAKTALAILASLARELGDLDRITGWGRVFGMVNSAPGFDRQPEVINGFSELILEVFGSEIGAHARSAVGMAELPFGMAVEIEGEVLLG